MNEIIKQLEDQVAQFQGQLSQLSEQVESLENSLNATQGGLNLLKNLQNGGYQLIAPKSEDGTTGEHDAVGQG